MRWRRVLRLSLAVDADAAPPLPVPYRDDADDRSGARW
jgi:hypothetical protein